MLDAKNVQLIK